MLLLCLLIFWQARAVPQHQFNMYNTDHHQDGFCLLYYVRDSVRLNSYIEYKPTSAHQIIPYCLRLSTESILTNDFSFKDAIDSNYTFAELRGKNISSQQLLSWSASINLAERYEMFLSNVSDQLLSSSSENETLFYNCTSSWFGPWCRFSFDSPLNMSLLDIIMSTFQSKPRLDQNTKVTCYKHHDCQTVHSFCLDWREICDRKMDCTDGSDELYCGQIEMNECASNEYRCYNGQCIPVGFFQNGPMDPDCLDRTDEPQTESRHDYCYIDPSFRCEEHTCRPESGGFDFPCGDGGCGSISRPRCANGRDNLFYDDPCSRTMFCFLYSTQSEFKRCNNLCTTIDCLQDRCSSFYEYPIGPVLFGHVYFLFSSNELPPELPDYEIPLPEYVCYNEELCEFLPATININGSTCRSFGELELQQSEPYIDVSIIMKDVEDRFRACLIPFNQIVYCNYSTMYQCRNSTKCISKHRLVDGFRDCPFDDDETFNQSCLLDDVGSRFSCLAHGHRKCFAPVIIRDYTLNCDNKKDEGRANIKLSDDEHIHFQKICDRVRDLEPIMIDEEEEHDETHCDYWLCNNTYTRCDGFWSCEDGADEMHCSPSSCPLYHHECVFPNDTSKVSCLPMSRAGDGVVDCLGGIDERNHCQEIYPTFYVLNFQCWNTIQECYEDRRLCDTNISCPLGDDETFCTNHGYDYEGVCYAVSSDERTEVEEYFCRVLGLVDRSPMIYFTLHHMPIYPHQLIADKTSVSQSTAQRKSQSMQNDRIIFAESVDPWRCNRGLNIHIRTSNGKDALFCLCPPSYYGDTCQYQNQRVSVSFKIQMTSDWHTLFTFVITLIDHERTIESYDYIDYLSIRDCKTKFHVYLLYSSRPKNPSKNYSVQIDAFQKSPLDYRTSWIFPMQFPFLPVYRLSVLLIVPISNVKPRQTCTFPCIHGQCYNYVNDENSTFCLCNSGWSGAQCTIKQKYHCAPNSLYLNDSICICPLNRFGPRCYLSQPSCRSDSCLNGGQCIPGDERRVGSLLNKPACICSEGYTGDRCEHRQRQTRIDISFHPRLTIPEMLLVHFITVQNGAPPVRTSIMKKIPVDQNSLTISTSIIFNMAFAEMNENYYIIILREQNIVLANVSTEIIPTHRCASIDELFNETVANQHMLKRIKSYQIPCQNQPELVCFYDQVHICLCDLGRQTNCFEFEHEMTYDCRGYNLCENEGQCFQDDQTCPTLAICVCRDCFYGSRCQFSTKGSTLSLDAILGYQIRIGTTIPRQPLAIKLTIASTTIMFVLGLCNSFFSYLTFRTKKAREVGCGLYLLASSITSMITMSILTLKFWFLLTTQIRMINNRLFIQAQCLMIDFSLRVFLNVGDWLSACVAIERTVNVTKGAHFNKAKSKQAAKWMIAIVFLFTSCMQIHDPIHRRLIDDKEEQRAWCVTEYSPSIKVFDWIVNTLHFSVPFLINSISALMIIITAARSRSNAQRSRPYKEFLSEQFRQHKHLIISSFLLVLLAVPRLIISFLVGCMKSVRNPWLYLAGYYISFVPPMLVFVVFVLPSETYKTEFKESIKRFWQR